MEFEKLRKTADLKGTWIAKYWQHRGQYTEACDSFEDAYDYLYWGQEHERLSSECIVAPDGSIFMNEQDLHDAYGYTAQDVIRFINEGAFPNVV